MIFRIDGVFDNDKFLKCNKGTFSVQYINPYEAKKQSSSIHSVVSKFMFYIPTLGIANPSIPILSNLSSPAIDSSLSALVVQVCGVNDLVYSNSCHGPASLKSHPT